MRAPCKDCPDRDHPRCYAVCEKYRAFRAERDQMSKERVAERQLNETFTDRITKQMRKKARKT